MRSNVRASARPCTEASRAEGARPPNGPSARVVLGERRDGLHGRTSDADRSPGPRGGVPTRRGCGTRMGRAPCRRTRAPASRRSARARLGRRQPDERRQAEPLFCAFYTYLREQRIPQLVTLDALFAVVELGLVRALAEVEETELAPTLLSFIEKVDTRLGTEQAGVGTELLDAYRIARSVVSVARALASTTRYSPPRDSSRLRCPQSVSSSKALRASPRAPCSASPWTTRASFHPIRRRVPARTGLSRGSPRLRSRSSLAAKPQAPRWVRHRHGRTPAPRCCSHACATTTSIR